MASSPPLHDGWQSPDHDYYGPFRGRHMVAQRGEVCPVSPPRGANSRAPHTQPSHPSGPQWMPGPSLLPCEALCPQQPPLRSAGPSSRVPVLILAWRPATEALARGRLKLCETAVSWHAGWGLFSRQEPKSGDTERCLCPKSFQTLWPQSSALLGQVSLAP